MSACISEKPMTRSGFKEIILSKLAFIKVQITFFSFFALSGLTVYFEIPTILFSSFNKYIVSAHSSVKHIIL